MYSFHHPTTSLDYSLSTLKTMSFPETLDSLPKFLGGQLEVLLHSLPQFLPHPGFCFHDHPSSALPGPLAQPLVRSLI